MKRILLVSLWTIISVNCQAQNLKAFNLDFEDKDPSRLLPHGWFEIGGDYNLSTDTIAWTGTKSVKIVSTETKEGFGAVGFMLPSIYRGDTIRLEGYMKTKNVKGYSGIMLRLDSKTGPIRFYNMEKDSISGTRDWQKYEVELSYPEEVEIIWVGGVLGGEGEAWYDDFKVSIDGVDIQVLAGIDKLLASFPSIDLNKLKNKLPFNFASLQLVWSSIILLLLFVIIWLLKRIVPNKKKARLKSTSLKDKVAPIESPKNNENLREQNVLLKDEKEQEIIHALERIVAKNYHLESECSLHNVAKKIKTNTTYLSRAVNNNYNKTFSEYISELRFDHVRQQMIENPTFRKYSTQAIAESAGYKSAVSFTRAFKKRTGLTPTQFAESLEDT